MLKFGAESSKRLSSMIKERGMTDNELHEFGEDVVEECIKVMRGIQNTMTADELVSRGYKHWDTYSGAIDDAIERIRKHFE